MTKKKKKPSILPKIEIMVILVFFFSFIVWAVSQCKAKKLLYEAQDVIENTLSTETVNDAESSSSTEAATTAPANTTNTTQTVGVPTSPTPNTSMTTIRERYTPLYVSIDGLNLRTGPHLDSSIIMKLTLFEEVVFLNQVSDSTQIINMGDELANEPWIKVRQQKGHVGWVYGAGIDYYKRQRSSGQ